MSINEERDYCLNLEEEIEDYKTLLNKGGRPSYLISLGRDILDDPREYREILSYWQHFTLGGEEGK